MAPKKKKEELDKEIELVKKEYEEKMSKKKKAKDKKGKEVDDKEKKKGDDDDESKRAEKERDDKVRRFCHARESLMLSCDLRSKKFRANSLQRVLMTFLGYMNFTSMSSEVRSVHIATRLTKIGTSFRCALTGSVMPRFQKETVSA